MIHIIRKALRKHDSLYKLKGFVEFDEGYFEKATSERLKLKRGLGSQRQKNVAVMAESIPLENENESQYKCFVLPFKSSIAPETSRKDEQLAKVENKVLIR